MAGNASVAFLNKSELVKSAAFTPSFATFNPSFGSINAIPAASLPRLEAFINRSLKTAFFHAGLALGARKPPMPQIALPHLSCPFKGT